jgi:hypothetical protein
MQSSATQPKESVVDFETTRTLALDSPRTAPRDVHYKKKLHGFEMKDCLRRAKNRSKKMCRGIVPAAQ